MALLTKIDYFGLSTSGWAVQSNSENKAIGSAEAQGDDGFTVAVESFGERLVPQSDYVATNNATLSSVVLGSVHTINNHEIALGNVSINTAAGQAPTMTASGSQIEDDGTGHCKCTLQNLNVSGLFHAQTFGLFTVTNGQLNSSTFSANGDIGIAECDGVIKSSDLVGGKVTITGTIVGVNDSGVISTPTVTLNTFNGKAGAFVQPLSLTNPNGQFPTYSFQAMWPLQADND